MKKINKLLLCIFALCLLVGCNDNTEEEIEKDLTEEIVIDEEGASAVCQIDYDYTDSEGYVMGAKFVIFTDENEIVTRVVGEQIASSNNKSKLTSLQTKMEDTYEKASQYGGYIYDIKISGKRLIIDTDIDYTELNLEEMAKNNEELKAYLNDDYQYTLSSIQATYMSTGADCYRK